MNTLCRKWENSSRGMILTSDLPLYWQKTDLLRNIEKKKRKMDSLSESSPVLLVPTLRDPVRPPAAPPLQRGQMAFVFRPGLLLPRTLFVITCDCSSCKSLLSRGKQPDGVWLRMSSTLRLFHQLLVLIRLSRTGALYDKKQDILDNSCVSTKCELLADFTRGQYHA